MALSLAGSPTSYGQFGPVVFLSDTFEDGVADGWATHQGHWSVVTDGTKVYQQSATSAKYRSSAGSSSWTDYRVEVKVKPLSWNGSNAAVAVLARFKDPNNHYSLSLRRNGTLRLSRVVSGTARTLSETSAPMILGAWHTLRVDVQGDVLGGYLDGNLLVSARDSRFATGRIAVGTEYAVAGFDDVVVTSVVPSPTPTPTPTSITPTPRARCAIPTPPPPAPAPTGLTALTGNQQVALSWTPAATYSTYEVYRSEGGGAFVRIATVTGLQYVDTGLTNGTTYTYHVRTFCFVGGGNAQCGFWDFLCTSPPSLPVSAVPDVVVGGVPAAPSGVPLVS